MAPRPSPLLPVSERGASCTLTLLAAVQDTGQNPELVHIVGAGEAELAMDFDLLAQHLPRSSQVILVGPHARGKSCSACPTPEEEVLLGPFAFKDGMTVSVFPSTYQRYLAQNPQSETPKFVGLFHPGLDIHYFSWYSCLKYWTDAHIPVMVSAYKVPGGYGESPPVVQKFIETLVGSGNGQGMWVMEPENQFSVELGSFNAGYFVFMGSEGVLPLDPAEMYLPLYQALNAVGHPFAPRVLPLVA